MAAAGSTILTERQIEVLELRKEGLTQQEVADRLGTTDSNVSAIERAAEQNIEKAKRTVALAETISSTETFRVPTGTYFDDLVDTVYAVGDDTGTKIDYCRPELYAHLFDRLEPVTERNRLVKTVEVGLTDDGDVCVFAESD